MTRYFRFTSGGVVWPERKVGDGDRPNAKQVVVIDFDDREQVYALADLMTQQLTDKDSDPAFCAAMLTALREFAKPTPPKPPEPTGLGLYRVRVERADHFDRVYFAHTPNGWWVLGELQQVGYSWDQICEDYDAATIEAVQS